MNSVVVLWFPLLVEFLFINLENRVLSRDNLISLFGLVLFRYLSSECEPFTLKNVFRYYVFYELLNSSTSIFHYYIYVCGVEDVTSYTPQMKLVSNLMN